VRLLGVLWLLPLMMCFVCLFAIALGGPESKDLLPRRARLRRLLCWPVGLAALLACLISLADISTGWPLRGEAAQYGVLISLALGIGSRTLDAFLSRPGITHRLRTEFVRQWRML
jgi:hypothetical protein